MSLVYFISAASNGFGQHIAIEALNRGHKVIATSRNASKLSDLKAKGATTFDLDVTSSLEDLKAIVARVKAVHGRIDVLINAAGYFLAGAVEEASPRETLDSFNVNVFGVINLTRAVVPVMREQKSGVIAHFGSVGSWQGVPGGAVYCASKWAISGFTEGLKNELEPFGIDVVCIEPGYFRTNFIGARSEAEGVMEEYDDTAAGQMRRNIGSQHRKQLGNVATAAEVIVRVLDGKQGKKLPLRLVLGSDAVRDIRQKCEDTLKLLDEWKDVSTSTDHEDAK